MQSPEYPGRGEHPLAGHHPLVGPLAVKVSNAFGAGMIHAPPVIMVFYPGIVQDFLVVSRDHGETVFSFFSQGSLNQAPIGTEMLARGYVVVAAPGASD